MPTWVVVFSKGANTPSRAFGPFPTQETANEWLTAYRQMIDHEYVEVVKLFGTYDNVPD